MYPTRPDLNNILLVKAVTETLNHCGDAIHLYKLNYLYPEDWITEKYPPQYVPFMYFRELRRLNEAEHVRDDEFQQASLVVSPTEP